MNSPKYKSGLFALVCLLTISLAGPLDAQDYDTENVILVSIDGIRDLEAFSFDPGDTAHPYIPFLYDTLAPKGTVYLEMYNDVCTFTSPGHATMLTGAWQMFPNYKMEEGHTYQVLAWEPTIFEYARKDLFFPKDSTWCIVGKTNCLETNYSIHPEYGEEYAANLVQVPTSIDTINNCTFFDSIPDYDAQTVDALLDTLDSKAPPLVFVNLRSVDEAGHLANQGKTDCDFDIYTEAIKRADRQVERIWNYVDTTQTYAGKTTLIVTTDHGRHDLSDTTLFNPPDTLDFTNHGGICHGCRHLFCVVVGPDTPDSTEVSRRTVQVDIAPTIMELLGGSAKYAEGQILDEAVGDTLTDRLIQLDPACDVHDSLVAVVWSGNYTGEFQIWCTTSKDHGSSFGDTVQISDSPIAAIQPDVAISDSGVHVVWMDFQLEDSTVRDDYDSWHLFYKKDSDFDDVWSEETLVDFGENVMETTYNDTAWYMWEPAVLAESRGGMVLVSMQPGLIGARFSTDGGNTWPDSGGVRVRGERKWPVNVDGCTLDNYSAAVTWCDQTDTSTTKSHNWEVYCASSDTVSKDDWYRFKRLSTTSSYSIHPTVDSDADTIIYVTWADNYSDSTFTLYFRKSTDKGQNWNSHVAVPVPSRSDSVASWQPDLVFDRTTSDDAHLVWVNYMNGGDGRLYYNFYNGSTWATSDTAAVPPPDGSVFRPDFAIDDDGNMFVVWTDVTDSSSVVKTDQDPSQ